MPTWGLTDKQRLLEPWGLNPQLLKPCKVTTDPIHGDVYTTFLEQAIIDTEPFQRLRRVRQLGTSHLVYPGATQTRFSHSLGALRVVQDLLDGITFQHEGPHPAPDLVVQWFAEDENEAAHHIARVIVLARLGALLHDLCHLPYGHSIEDDLQLLPPHDAGEKRFKGAWRSIKKAVRKRVEAKFEDGEKVSRSLDPLLKLDGDLLAELKPLIISKGGQTKPQGEMDYPFVADLVGNTICADLLDYLRRDHQYTGLPVSLGTRFTSAFFITPDGRGLYSRRMALNLIRDDHERTDEVSELLKALRFRYELSERVLVHHTKLAADAMVGKMLELYADALWLEEAAAELTQLGNRDKLLGDANLAKAKAAVRKLSKKRSKAIDRRVGKGLERLLLSHGDDGLLEFIATHEPKGEGDRPAELKAAAGKLARQLLSRRLFKVGGRVGIEAAPAKALFDQFGDADSRRKLQDEAQRFAEMGSRPELLIWLPDPKMRLKQAKVLVDDGSHINTFVNYERVRSRRGSDIYDAHERLWATWVFFDPAVEKEKREEALVFLARKLGVCWEKMKPAFGADASEWIERLAFSRFTELEPLHTEIGKLIEEQPTAARGLGEDAIFSDHYLAVESLEAAQKLRDRNQQD